MRVSRKERERILLLAVRRISQSRGFRGVQKYPFGGTESVEGSLELNAGRKVLSLGFDAFEVVHIVLPAILGLFVRK